MKVLDIQTVRPQLDIRSTRAQIQINSRMRKFSAKRVAPQMSVDTKMPTFKVDWSTVWAESGRRSPGQLRNYMVQSSRAAVDQAISRIVSNGEYAKQLEAYKGSKASPIGQMAWQNYLDQGAVETNVGQIPQSLPNIEWDPGYININWSVGELQVQWDDDFRPDIRFTPHSVEIRLTAHPEVKMQVTERYVPGERGRKVNQNA